MEETPGLKGDGDAANARSAAPRLKACSAFPRQRADDGGR